MQQNSASYARFSRLIVLAAAVLCAWPVVAELPKFATAQLGSDRFGAPLAGWSFGPDDQGVSISDNGYVRAWDTATKHLRWEARPTHELLQSVSFAGSTVVAATSAGEVFVLNAADGTEVKRFKLELCNKPCTLKSLRANDKLIATNARPKDGRLEENTLRLWSLTDGKLLQSHSDANVSDIALSPKSDKVAWIRNTPGGLDGVVVMANAVDLSHPQTLACKLRNDDYEMYARVRFSPDAKTFVAIGNTSTTSSERLLICTWAADKPSAAPHTTELLTEEDPDSGSIPLLRGVIFSADSKWLSVVYDEGNYGREDFYVERTTHKFVEVASGKTLKSYEDGSPKDLAWVNAHDAAVVTGGEYWTKGRPLYASYNYAPTRYALSYGQKSGDAGNLPPDWMMESHHNTPIKSLAVNADASQVVSTDARNRSLLWRRGQADAAVALQTYGQVAFSPSGALYQTSPAELEVVNDECDGEMRVGNLGHWDLTNQSIKTLRRGPKLMTKTLHWLADGKLLTCREQHKADSTECGYAMGPVEGVFETMNPDGAGITPLKGEFAFCPPPQAVSVSALRSFVVYAPGDPPEPSDGFNSPGRIIDLKTGSVLLEASQAFLFPALSPDGKWYAAFTQNSSSATPPVVSQLKVYDVDTKALVTTLEVPAPSSWPSRSPILFSPDSKHLIAAHGDQILVVNLATKAVAHTLTGHTSEVRAFAFSGDGKALVSAQSDGLIYTWDWPALQQ